MQVNKAKVVTFIKNTFIVLSIAMNLYTLVTFFDIPYIADLRDLYIETAMTTADHQWLATYIFPKSVIDKVMANKVEDTKSVAITDVGSTGLSEIEELQLEKKYMREHSNKVSDTFKEQTYLFEEFVEGTTDKFGNKVLVNDTEQGIVILDVVGKGYRGKMAFIDDPSRVYVAHTDKKGESGLKILEFLEKNDAILGINANGFNDPGGHGTGGQILGFSRSQGEDWGAKGAKRDRLVTIGFDENNRLVAGYIADWDKYKLRDAAQFKPLLISNGEIVVGKGWGIQPRTIVGQRADGVVVFLVVDGRQPTHSLGITMLGAAELLKKYGVVTAAACDGGSSSIIAYKGEIVNKSCSASKEGRRLPNAILVRKK